MLSSASSPEGQAAPSPRYWLRDEPPDLNESDAFAVSRMVDRLVSLVKASPAPFTLSLSGSWGIGKSTIAEALVKRVRVGPEPMKACLVDAWTEDVDHLRRTLAIAVGAELRGGEQYREAVANALDEPVRSSHGKSKPKAELALPESLRSIPRRPAPFLIAVLVIETLVILALIFAGNETLKIFLPVVTTLLGATLVAAALQTGFVFRVETSTETQAPAVESVHMARQFADTVTGKTDGVAAEKVLVVVDNLDRLPGKDALHALAEIRSLVEIKGSRCVFLIPVDRAAFAGHLQSALSDDVSAKDYLDKFFNLDVLLTQPEPLDVRDWATEQATPLFADVASPEDIAAAVQVVASMAGGSPRSVKRIINGVSTRLRMLDESVTPRPTLAQLSFIEGLIVRFPEMVAWLESEPRNFADARASITAPSGGTKQDEELAKVLSAAGLAPDRSTALRAVLLRNTDIDMPAGLIRLVMGLREDRAWKGLADPQAIREALETGEADAYAAALDAIEPDLRQTAVSRSVGWVERSVPSFPRDAMTNLIAIAGRIADYPSSADSLRPTAMRVMRRMDEANLTRITPALALFVLGEPSTDHAARAGVAAAYAGLVSSDDFDGPWVDGVIQALRLGSADIPQPSLETVRTRLAGLPDDVVDAVWSPTVDLNLVSGAMVEAYVARLVEAPALEDTEPLVLRRMVEFAKAGGVEPALPGLAAAISKHLAAAGAVPVEALPYLDLVIDALSHTDGAEIDALATSLVTPTPVDSVRVLAMALRLDTSASVGASIVAEVDGWLALPDVKSDDARLLLESHSSALSTAGVDIAGRLMAQWIARGETAFAQLAIEFTPESAYDVLLAALGGSSANAEFPDRCSEAIGLIGTDVDGRLSKVAALSANWISGTPVAAIASLGKSVLALQTAAVDCAPILEAVQSRIEAPGMSAADLLTVCQALMTWEAGGVTIPAALAVSMTKRMAAVGVVDSAAAKWSAKKTKGSADARLLLVAIINDTDAPLAAVLDAVSSTAGAFRQNHEVATALVARAATESNIDGVRGLLEEAVRWKRPKGDRGTFETNLSTISTANPDMDDLVNELRKT